MKPFYRLLLIVAMSCLWMHGAAGSTAQEFTEGSQYKRIDPPAPLTDHKGKVEVVEMFFYACPHCYELEPKLKKWLKDKPYVDFHRMPAIAGPQWADQARAYYMIQELGKPEQMDQAIFDAIQKGGKQIYNEYSVLEFFASQGVDREKANALYLSPEIAAQVNQARVMTVKYGLRGVPAVIVNGEYVTAPYFVRNQEEMLKVLDSLVAREKAKLDAAQQSRK